MNGPDPRRTGRLRPFLPPQCRSDAWQGRSASAGSLLSVSVRSTSKLRTAKLTHAPSSRRHPYRRSGSLHLVDERINAPRGSRVRGCLARWLHRRGYPAAAVRLRVTRRGCGPGMNVDPFSARTDPGKPGYRRVSRLFGWCGRSNRGARRRMRAVWRIAQPPLQKIHQSKQSYSP